MATPPKWSTSPFQCPPMQHCQIMTQCYIFDSRWRCAKSWVNLYCPEVNRKESFYSLNFISPEWMVTCNLHQCNDANLQVLGKVYIHVDSPSFPEIHLLDFCTIFNMFLVCMVPDNIFPGNFMRKFVLNFSFTGTHNS